jgi:hypothetical protein
VDYREAGGRDRLDVDVQRRAPPIQPRVLDLLLRTRAAIGLRPLAAPALIFVPLGFALGPRGLGMLPPRALATLDPVVTVALSTLGVFIGLALAPGAPRAPRLFGAASLEACITLVAVGGASVLLMQRWGVPLDASAAIVAAVLGVTASVSSAGDQSHGEGSHVHASRIAELDDGFAVLAGAIAVSAIHAETFAATLSVLTSTVLIGVLAGIAGWLLFERAGSDAERGVFVLGTLALLGGGADYVRGSPLLAGLVAGALWHVLPGHADRIVRDDVSRFQHPLVLLLLLGAGAWADPSVLALWLFAPFVVFRYAGKVFGAWVAQRVVAFGPSPTPSSGEPRLGLADFTAFLLPPGLLGIAVALNLLQVTPSPTATAVLSAVAAGTLVSEILAAFVLAGSDSTTR